MRIDRGVLRALFMGATLFLVANAAAVLFDPLRQGLTATYFSDRGWSSTPTLSRVDRDASTDSMVDAWYGVLPASFSATWSGSFFVSRGGTYTFATNSDDGSWLYVDGTLVVDNGGGHRATLKRGALTLKRGVHSIFIKYFQEGGPLQLDVLWARDDEPLQGMPAWMFSTRHSGDARTLASTLLRRALWPAFSVWLLAVAAGAIAERHRLAAQIAKLAGQPARMCAAGLVVFVGLTIVHTWPLATSPGHLSRNDNGDTLLNTWAIAWVAHQLPRDPRHLFDANIFYPARLTLAYSESMIVQGVLAMPVIALGGSPVLAYNLVLMAGFALTAWSFFLLVWHWTRSWSAAYISGALAGFNAHVLVELPHLQFQHLEFVPLILFALDRIITSRRVRDGCWLGIGFALQSLTSVYVMVFTGWMVLFAALARARAWTRERPARTIGLFALAASVTLLLLAPYLAAYRALHNATGFERAIGAGASWADFLQSGSRLYFPLWGYRLQGIANRFSFPGLTAIALVVLAWRWPETRGDARMRMCGIAAVGCTVVAMLPGTPIYPALHRAILLFRVVRVPAHLGEIVLLMIAVIAGFGVAGLGRRWRAGPWPLAALVLFGLVNVEALRAPFEYTPFRNIPHVYDVLAAERDAVVVELPFPRPGDFFLNADYMLNSTRHWRPILNGYSGFLPPWYGEMYRDFLAFPSDASISAMRKWGATHVVVHGAAVTDSASLVAIAADDDIHIYRLR